jgi:hypothetical protein
VVQELQQLLLLVAVVVDHVLVQILLEKMVVLVAVEEHKLVDHQIRNLEELEHQVRDMLVVLELQTITQQFLVVVVVEQVEQAELHLIHLKMLLLVLVVLEFC